MNELKGPCWPECKKMLLLQLQSEIERIEAIMQEREKATELLARNEVSRQTTEIMREYVLRKSYDEQMASLQQQITGPLGLELRMRSQEQKGGALDAKLYLVIVGLPLAVSVTVAIVVNIFLAHIMK